MKPPRHSRYARHGFPAEVISHVVWLYFRFLLSLRMLAARGLGVSHETVRQWALKFGQDYTNQIHWRHPDMTRPLRPDYDPARLTQFKVASPPRRVCMSRTLASRARLRPPNCSWLRSSSMCVEPRAPADDKPTS
jgi:hypothetical protein